MSNEQEGQKGQTPGSRASIKEFVQVAIDGGTPEEKPEGSDVVRDVNGNGDNVVQQPDGGVPPVQPQQPVDYTKLLIPEHRVVSREVKNEDLGRVMEDARKMLTICRTPLGLANGAYAIAHSQITKDDPLRFFVANSGIVVINPVITRHIETPYDFKEGCMTYPDMPMKPVKRYHKITATYQVPTKKDKDDKDLILSDAFVDVEYSGLMARIFQHEIAHFNGKYIYDEGAKPDDALPIEAK